MARKILTVLKKIALGLLVSILVLALLEGLASFALFARDMARTRGVAERLHTEYDEQLGWINTPGARVDDMYGPGTWLKINAQGFRGNDDVSRAIPAGKTRIICTGDSFALGYGVDNDHTWCHLLAAQDPRLQTVNMGQGGYGVDQAYLWYKREAGNVDHDVLVFSFVSHDFERMQHETFLGYPKPLLKVTDGKLQVTNVPVPESGTVGPWMQRNHNLLMEVKIFRILNGLAGRIRPAQRDTPDLSDAEARDVAGHIFAELQAITARKGVTLVLLHLPTERDVQGADVGGWRAFVREQAEQRGIALIDLLEDMRTVGSDDLAKLFIAENVVGYAAAAGHYTEKGNEAVAKWLYARLQRVPAVAAKLSKTGPASGPAPVTRPSR